MFRGEPGEYIRMGEQVFPTKGARATSSINIAGALAQYGRRVLIVDFDPQGAATVGLGVNANTVENTIYTALFDISVDPHDVVQHTAFENIDVIPANIDLSAAEVQLVTEVGREQILNSGVALLMQSIEKVQSRINPALEVDGVLITMYTKTLHCEEVCQRVYEAFSEKVFHTFISRSIKLPDSTVAAAPVVVYAPEHKTSKEYREVARELIARGIVA